MDFRTTGRKFFDSQLITATMSVTSPTSQKWRNTVGGLVTGAECSAPVFHVVEQYIPSWTCFLRKNK